MFDKDDDFELGPMWSIWQELSKHPELSCLRIVQWRVNGPYVVSIWHSDREAYLVAKRNNPEDGLRALLLKVESAARGPRKKRRTLSYWRPFTVQRSRA